MKGKSIDENSGRASRAEFWCFWGVLILIDMIIEGYFAGFGAIDIYYIPSLFALVLVGIRRLHDINKSAWWMLLYSGQIAMHLWVILIGERDFDADFTDGLGFLELLLLISLIFLPGYFVLIYMWTRKSDPDANQYGKPQSVSAAYEHAKQLNAKLTAQWIKDAKEKKEKKEAKKRAKENMTNNE